MAKPADVTPSRQDEWEEILRSGPRGLLSRGPLGYRLARPLMRRLPANGRCKNCNVPFGGVIGRVVGALGFAPSRKNPRMCQFCLDRMPPGGAEVDLAVLFADVRGSTGLGERLAPSLYAALMNRFYHAATQVLLAHDAVIDKMVGDEVMALFIPGYCGAHYRRLATEAAEALVRSVGYGGTEGPWLSVGVGVHAGMAFAGNVGGSGVMDFTALGDTVNTAARLQAEAAGGEVILSEALYPEVALRHPILEQRTLELRGREEPLMVRVLRIVTS